METIRCLPRMGSDAFGEDIDNDNLVHTLNPILAAIDNNFKTLQKWSETQGSNSQYDAAEMESCVDRVVSKRLASAVNAITKKLEEKADLEKMNELKQVVDAKLDESAWDKRVRGFLQKLEEPSRAWQDLQERLDDKCAKIEASFKDIRAILALLDNKPAFFGVYKTVDVPRSSEELDQAVESLVRAHAEAEGIAAQHQNDFLDELRRDANSGERPSGMDPLGFRATRYWTSAATMFPRHTQFCGIVNQSNREDSVKKLLGGSIQFQKALNSLVVTRGKKKTLFPSNGLTHRGSGIPHVSLNFWQHDVKYRCPPPLASSFKLSVAMDFMERITDVNLEPVHFILKWDLQKKCEHACYIEKISSVSGEEELILAAYSVLTVERVDIVSNPTADHPHTITLLVCSDNRTEMECLPLASWH